MVRQSGQVFDIQIISVYSGLTGQLPSDEMGLLEFSNETFCNNVLSFDWRGDVDVVS